MSCVHEYRDRSGGPWERVVLFWPPWAEAKTRLPMVYRALLCNCVAVSVVLGPAPLVILTRLQAHCTPAVQTSFTTHRLYQSIAH